MNFLMVCGGTAGHINPALAIASQLREMVPDARVIFAGAGKELEKKLIPHAGYHLVNIKMSGIRRDISPQGLAHNIKTLRNLATAGAKAENLISRFKPDAVIGTGGYICYPILKKAAQMRIPTIVHESNAVPGLTTKLLSACADRMLVAFPGLEQHYRRPERVVFTGTPVRSGFAAENASGAATQHHLPLVVSFWGSLGAERMNEIMTEFIRCNIGNMLFRHIHAAGKRGGAAAMKERLVHQGAAGELPEGIEIREYIDNMQTVMAEADIVMCRAGGSTLAEVTVMGKPAVLIPSPYVTNDQQTENAKQIEKAGGAIMLHEKDCNGKMLYDTVVSLLADTSKLAEMAEAQRALGVPNAAEKISEIILGLCSTKM